MKKCCAAACKTSPATSQAGSLRLEVSSRHGSYTLFRRFREGAAVIALPRKNGQAVAPDPHFDGVVIHRTFAPGRVRQRVLVARLFRDPRVKLGECVLLRPVINVASGIVGVVDQPVEFPLTIGAAL